MTDKTNESKEEEVIFEREITAEEIEALAHPNIVVDDYRVTLKSVTPWIFTFLLGGAYFIALIIAFHEGLAELSVAGCLIFAIATLFFLACLVRQRVTTVFDRLERTVHRRNPLQAMADIPFADIAEIAMVNDAGAVYFKIAPKADRLGKGFRITRNYDNNNEEFFYMLMRARPAISGMLEAGREQDSAAASAWLAERPVLYSRSGHVYTFASWRNQIMALIVSVAMLSAFAFLDDWLRWIGLVIGGLAFPAAFFIDNRIIIDARAKTIRFATPVGLLETSLPLSRYSGLHVVRNYTNGLYTHTTVSLEFRDPEQRVDLYSAIWTKTLSALAVETEAIISAAKDGPDESGTPT